eukprot:m51a1_g11310 putative Nbp35 (351) ;mRNA; f:89775-91157
MNFFGEIGACGPERRSCVPAAAPAPAHCPGPESEAAGTSSACAGCPNRAICASAASRRTTVDPDLAAIRQRMASVKHKVVVLSGKGGVGKSTFSAQLAFALASAHERCGADGSGSAREPLQVGLMDVDICGPSIPRMLGIEAEDAVMQQTAGGWTPVYVNDNLAAVSVGFLLEDPDEAVVWRGPKKNGLIKQFLREVEWGELDYLVIDTPPGTSDEHLSVVQYLKAANPDGAIIVTSPQDVALIDVRKEIRFCQRVGLRVLGVVENMSGFVCPCCRKESTIFPKTSGGAQKMAQDFGIPFLGKIPLDPLIARSCDEGRPYFAAHPEAEASQQFFSIFDGVLASLGEQHSA